ncbi:MAG: transglutaminase domain-containing protein [Microbacteriaceae bacterium]|nr:transglutaminase domain-containing protein [Microbacteriaceae bacterium]
MPWSEAVFPKLWRGQHPRAWRISIALVACFCAATASLHPVVQAFEWWLAVMGVVLVVLGSAALSRALSPRRWLPTVVASLALVAAVTAFFARGTAFLFIIPMPQSFGAFGNLLNEGGASIAGQTVPAEATLGVVFLLSLGAGLLAIAADLLAVAFRRPALAAVPLAVILGIPTLIGSQLADVFFILLTAGCWLILLRAGQPHAQTSRSLAVAALAVVAALVVPVVLPPAEGTDALGDGTSGYLASVNPVLSLGDELRRDLPRTILTYRTQSGDPAYLRLVSLQNFHSDTWEPDPPTIDRDNSPQSVGDPPGLSAAVSTEAETTWVEVGNLGSPWLPVPYPATMVSGLRGDWFWDARDLTFTSPHRTARGEEYQVSSLLVQPTPAQLELAGNDSQGGVTAAGVRYLDLPPDLPGIIGGMAREATAAATGDYGRAVALQEFFRNGAFDYSETAPVDNGYDANGMTAIAQFLVAGSGYCIHFASAMAVMARTLGIPSRVAVGLLPGEKLADAAQGPHVYRVTTQDVHTWPELYFDGIGWTRFEPTPGRGFVPRYADEATPGVPITPNSQQQPSATSTPTAAPTRSAEPLDRDGAAAGPDWTATLYWWLWTLLVALGIALLLLIPAAVRVGQRTIRLRRFARGYPAATTGWRELLQSAHDLGIDISSTATPRGAALAISRAVRLGERDQEALASVLDLVERQSFAGELPNRVGNGAHRVTAEGAAWAHRITSILAQLRTASGWRARIAAVIAPRSIWSRAGVTRED